MPRRAASIDFELFQELVEKAAAAFSADPIYAVAMLRSSGAITRKREVWRARKDLKEGEKQAIDQCSKVDVFVCDNKQSCGTGQCKFAQGDLTLITVESVRGDTQRPQEWSSGPYSLLDSLNQLIEIRNKLC